MQSETKPKRNANAAYPERLSHYDNVEGMGLLNELAQRRGQNATSLLRALVREEARREGLTPGQTTLPMER